MSDAEPAAPPPREAPDPRRRVIWLVTGVVCSLAILLVLFQTGWLRSKAEAEPKGKQARGIPVRVAKAERRTLTLSARHRGELDAEVAELAAQATGRLEGVDVDIGDRVKQGQLLARVDASQTQRQIAEAQAQVRAADASKRRAGASLAAARTELDRGRRLHQEKILSQAELDGLESKIHVLGAEEDAADAQSGQARARVSVLQQQARETKLLAPFDGAVADRFLDRGALVQPGTKVLRIVKGGALRVRFRAPERDLGRITRGMPVEITTQATGTQRFVGKVTRISAEVSRSDRSAAVEAELDAETEVLRAGMYAEVALTLGSLTDAVVVPSAAVVQRDETNPQESGVYVVKDRIAHFRPVKVLGTADDHTAVDALALGDEVIVLGHDGLRDGSTVRVGELDK